MKKLLLLRGFERSVELQKLLGSRLIEAPEAARIMLAKLTRAEDFEAANTDDFFVRVCVASEENVVRALRALARHSGTLIREIRVQA